jgi:transposase
VKSETSTNGRPRKISKVDAMTLSLYQHQSTRATKKSVYEDFKEELKCSYKTLVVSMNASALMCLRLLFIIMRLDKKNQHLVKYTDATDIPVCLKKNGDRHKTMAGLASFGRSSKGWFYGVKMTLTRDADGRMLTVKFTTATANDRDTFRSINKDIFGIIVADAGYVSKQLEKDMNIDGKRWVLIRPYKTMKKLMTEWQEDLYKGRFQIEFDFRSLKMFYGLVTSLPRSVNGYLANYIHALTSFVLR